MLKLEITMSAGNTITFAHWDLVKGNDVLNYGDIELFAVHNVTELFKFEYNCKAIKELANDISCHYKDKIETNFYIQEEGMVISYFNRKTIDKLLGTIYSISTGHESWAWD